MSERPPARVNIIITSDEHGAPWVAIEDNFLERCPEAVAWDRAQRAGLNYGEPLPESSPEEAAQEMAATNLPLDLELEIPLPFYRDLDVNGYAIAVQHLRELLPTERGSKVYRLRSSTATSRT